jgi:hypothetical protein
MNDQTGQKCATGQNSSSPIFFLELNNGGISHRTCKVTAGKALLIPVMTVEESDKESPGASDQDLSNYQDLLKYRVHTDAYNLNFANNGIFGIIQDGPTRDVADGFFVMTEPLAKGTYFIHYKSSCCLSSLVTTFVNIIYHLLTYRAYLEDRRCLYSTRCCCDSSQGIRNSILLIMLLICDSLRARLVIKTAT